MRKYFYPLALCLSWACSNTLFENGTSSYSIVIDADSPETEQYAAAELQYWIKEVSGAELPIAAEGIPGKRLIVGGGDFEPGDDSFTYRSEGGDILFQGGSRRGTLYAVYSFLEKEFGCRWYSSAVSVAPKMDRYSFRSLYNHEEPGILIRDNCVLDVRTNPVFSARQRNNFIKVPSRTPAMTVPGSAEGYWGVHALGYHVPSAKYYKSHPEYFALRDGKRQEGYAQLCLSNPDVLEIVIKSLRNVMSNEPDYLIYSVEQNDNQLYCECENCNALAAKYGAQSGVMIWFVNQVADAVKDEFPGKFVGTFAYQYTRHAPRDIVPRENVVVRLCSIECCLLHNYDECEMNLSFAKDLGDWGSIAPHLYIWDYVTDFSQYCLPVANWKTMQSHIRDFRKNHAIGILEEGDYQTPACELKEMRTWILSKLMWNPDSDVDALIKDFTDGYYGAAGPFVREYLDLEERILRREGMHTNCYALASHEMFTMEFIDEGRAIFERARNAVGADSTLLRRLESAEWPLCFLQMEHNPMKGIETGAEALVRRVIARDGITRLSEADWTGGHMQAGKLLEGYDKLRRMLGEVPLMKAKDAEKGKSGVSYRLFEGDFMSTFEMLRNGKVTEEGVMDTVGIDGTQERDHFGYEFTFLLDAVRDGVHQFSITSDDGAVLFVDGQKVIDIDGSHSPLLSRGFVNLEKGLHDVMLLYFEDCEGQRLEVSIYTPDGYHGSLPKDRLYCR